MNDFCPLHDSSTCLHPDRKGVCQACQFDFETLDPDEGMYKLRRVNAENVFAQHQMQARKAKDEEARLDGARKKKKEEEQKAKDDAAARIAQLEAELAQPQPQNDSEAQRLRAENAVLQRRQADLAQLLAAEKHAAEQRVMEDTAAKVRLGHFRDFAVIGLLVVGFLIFVLWKSADWPAKAVSAPELAKQLPNPIDDAQKYPRGTVLPAIAFQGGTTPEMVIIPAGTYNRGSMPNEAGRREKEDADEGKAPIPVTLARPFAVAKNEVTRGEWKAFVAANPAYNMDGACSTWIGTKWDRDATKSWRNPGYEQTDAHPVACVNWNDAKAYAAWLSAQTGHKYRLLTEAEWEYAARADGAQRNERRYWGEDKDNKAGCAYANAIDTAAQKHFNWGNQQDQFQCSDGFIFTAPVGQFRPNEFGLYDMLGNVSEWVEDCHVSEYSGAPKDGRAAPETADCSRIHRGGSWDENARVVRAAFRSYSSPNIRYSYNGFRLARTVL